MKNNLNWAFFGTDNFSVMVLDELKKNDYLPSLIITTEDKPKGRKLLLTPPEVKIWADRENIKCLQLKSLRVPLIEETIKSSNSNEFDFFVVASYGKIIPENILDIPKHKTLNVHPSLLPKLRGPSPIQSAILNENETGVSIMKLDKEMDHGPILAQEKIDIEWPPYADDLEKTSAETGAKMLTEIIPKWLSGELKEIEQNHDKATVCKKVEKIDAEMNLNDNPEINLRKIRAYYIWPGAYFFEEREGKKIRIIVKKAHIENGDLVLDRIIPEGKKEMSYSDYKRGLRN